MRIYYLCPDWKHETYGGLKKIYHHVQALNELGFSAFVVHKEKGFKLEWFSHQAPVDYQEELQISDDDIFVIPEIFAFEERAFPKNRFVIFNQAPYLTFQPLGLPSGKFSAARDIETYPYFHPQCLGTLVVSKNSCDYLETAFPGIKLHRIRLSIDYELFSYRSEKKKQIAYMPRKCPKDIVQVLSLLMAREKLKGWRAVPIQNEDEATVAKILGESAIFLSFSLQEGFSLPPREAIACGCRLVGFHGPWGKEFLNLETAVEGGKLMQDFESESLAMGVDHSQKVKATTIANNYGSKDCVNLPPSTAVSRLKEPYAYQIMPWEIANFAKKVEEVALDYMERPDEYKENSFRGSEFIRNEYSNQNEREDLKKAWSSLLGN